MPESHDAAPPPQRVPRELVERLLVTLEGLTATMGSLEERFAVLDALIHRFEAQIPEPPGLEDLYPKEKPIQGYAAIARFVSKITNSSFSTKTCRDKASGRDAGPRLPVWRFQGAQDVFALPSHLIAWARLSLIPVGARMPGRRPPGRHVARET